LETEPSVPPAAPQKFVPPAIQPADEPPSEEFAALFHEQSNLDSEDIEAFWKTAADASGAPLPPGSDAITYEQARKMGLASGLDEEKTS
jgi:hypothetical protein